MATKQKHFFPLGTKLHFYVNSTRNVNIILTTNMAALSHGKVVNQECLPGVSYMYATGSSQTCKYI